MSEEKKVQEIDVESLDSDLAAARKLEENKNTLIGKITAVIAIAWCIFQMVTVFKQPDVIPHRGIHVAFAFTILILANPFYEKFMKGKFKNNAGFKTASRVGDFVMIAALWFAIYLCSYEYSHLSANLGKAGDLAIIAGAILTIVVLEGTRRVLGWIMPILAMIFFAYAWFGHVLPGALGHKKYTLVNLLKYLSIDLDGIFGTTISVSATTIFMFVMFGAFLEACGASTFINDLALSVTGKLRCGPALAAVVASALMGCINGSAVANVVGTGTFTIPLMKSRGYRPDFAAGVESVASTGGQILPPVMGSGAFLMVAFTAEPYTKIVTAAVIPAILYFLGAGFAVFAQGEVGDVELLPEDQIPKTLQVLKDGWVYIVIIGALVWALLGAQYSPNLSGFIGVVSVPVVMILFDRKKKRFTVKDILPSMIKTGYSGISIVAGCACAGVVVAMVSRTGIGVVFGDMMIGLAHKQLLPSLIFTAVACIILGMGLPTTSAYVIAASILAPALTKLGLSLLVSHLFVFYFACLSAITPPVALAAFAGAGIAKCDPMTTAVNACMIGFAGFIVPFVFCFEPAMMLDGTLIAILKVAVTALIGCVGMSCGLQGWWFSGHKKINPAFRAVVILGGFLMMIPNDIGAVVGLVILVVTAVMLRAKTAKAAKAA